MSRNLALAIAGFVAALTVALIVVRRWRRPTPDQIECARRLRIHAVGRLASGEILDLIDHPDGLPPTLVYQYEVGGVTYQVSQALHLVPIEFDPESWIPGWPVQVKYDNANPGNSIVACEHWRGLSSSKKR